MSIPNLEPLCARHGRKMVSASPECKKQENILTKALGVLAENGIYAMSVYLLSCHEKEYGKRLFNTHLRELWTDREVGLISPENSTSAALLTSVKDLTGSLSKLILCRKITEQSLVFARYHAKAEIKVEDG